MIVYGTQHGRAEEDDVEEAATPNETPANRKGMLRTIMVLTIGITFTFDLSLDVVIDRASLLTNARWIQVSLFFTQTVLL